MILWLDEITSQDRARVGTKALRLAQAARAGFPVPRGFCVTTDAYSQFVAHIDLMPILRDLPSQPARDVLQSARQLQDTLRSATPSSSLTAAILSAYDELGREAGREPAVAVRSSATAEDLAEASFAGQQATLLHVSREALVRVVIECWASLWSPRAVAYRVQRGVAGVPQIAVLVQTMVEARAAGVAFSMDPVRGDPVVVIEASFGLGETVVAGQASVDRYVVDPETGQEVQPAVITTKSRQRVLDPQGGVQQADVPPAMQQARVLSPVEVKQVAQTVTALARHFECPQDAEWAFEQEHLHLLQTRPITSVPGSIFTDRIPGDNDLWTAGFLNERFPRPVSPLGWSVIRELLDELAFRDPLRYLGYAGAQQLQVTKLYRGHPYVNMFVFQTLYRVFPETLLPEGASRYFPEGQTGLRYEVAYPRSWLDPPLLLSVVRHLLLHPTMWSPWHQHRAWQSFAHRHQQTNGKLTADYESLRRHAGPPEHIWAAIATAQSLNAELLALHRWSLTLADLAYSLLRRLLRHWVQQAPASSLAAQLVAGLPNKTLEMDAALWKVAHMQDGSDRETVLQAFLTEFGHRSFCLDLYCPTFADDPSQVERLLEKLRDQRSKPPKDQRARRERALADIESALGSGPPAALRRVLLRQVISWSQRYMPLREEQRFFWQKTLALQRKLFLLMGKRMVESGALTTADQVFSLTKPEIEVFALRQPRARYATLANSRQQAFERLQRDFDTAPAKAYPPFLRGNQPWSEPRPQGETQYSGQAVSAGLARGRVVICFSPSELGKVSAGDVLVTRSVDPAWTPVFGLLSALVLEHGGQLSHGAVVAREYGLPTVTGIHGITQLLHDGETVLVDGLRGVVVRETIAAT